MHALLDESMTNTGHTRPRRVATSQHELDAGLARTPFLDSAPPASRLTRHSMKAWGKTLDPSGSSGVSAPLHLPGR